MLSHVVFEDCPGFKFFGADDVLVVRSLGLPADLNEWEYEHYELVSEVLGVPTDFMHKRLKWAYHGGSDGWAMKSYHDEGGFSLADLEAKGVSRDDVLRLHEEGCLIGGSVRVLGDEELLFACAQFWGGADGGVMIRPELFECVKVFSRVGVSPHVASDFLFYPVADYGFLCPWELLLSGDEGLRTLVLADAYSYALKRREKAVFEDFAQASVENVPTPERVTELAKGAVLPSVGDGSVSTMNALSKALGIPAAVLTRRLDNADERPKGFPSVTVKAKLRKKLETLWWSDERITAFLEGRSPMFGLVTPTRYATFGDASTAGVVHSSVLSAGVGWFVGGGAVYGVVVSVLVVPVFTRFRLEV